jgi:uncharacterized membrane protein
MYSPLLILHILGGVIAVLSGAVALIVRKGSRLHRRSGDVFVISMLCMSASGAYAAVTKSQPGNVVAGVFTFYLVSTAWVTVARKRKETERLALALLLLGLAAGIGALVLGRIASHGGLKGGGPVAMYFVFGTIALLATAGDARVLIRGGIAGAQRMVRHVWRMCLALLIATGSFFLGTAGDPVLRKTGLRARLFTHAVRETHLPELPVLLVVLAMIFWLCRIWFTNTYKKTDLSAIELKERASK